MGQTSRELVRGLFEGKDTASIPFIPWISSFAAQLEQVPVSKMLSDAGLLSRALINSQKLFGYDAIINVFDPSLEAEACGCRINWSDGGVLPEVISHPLNEGVSVEELNVSGFEKKGRLPVVIDATKRLHIIKGKEVAIACLVTSPLTLAVHLKGKSVLDDLNQGKEEATEIVETTGSIVLKLCRIYCEIGIDLIVIVDEMLGQTSSEVIQTMASPLKSIWNVVKFYDVHSLLLTKDCTDKLIEPIFNLQAEGVAVSGDFSYTKLKETAQRYNSCFARTIPLSSLSGTVTRVGDSTIDCLSKREKGLFLSTEWDVPYTTDVNNMHEIMRVIRDVRGA